MNKDDDVNHGSAASSRVLSRRNFLKVSVTSKAAEPWPRAAHPKRLPMASTALIGGPAGHASAGA
jgi:hypothetical protein